MMLSFENIFRFTCICLVYTHNIIRLDDQRFAKFILRHIDKVPTKPHFYEFQSDSLEVCFDRCVATTPCISINYNMTGKRCQLVNYDINMGKDYEARSGWQHFDTGRTSIVRILSSDKNYCITIESEDQCNPSFTSTSEHSLLYKEINRAACKGVGAYFDFDRFTGVLVHYCSGLVVEPRNTYVVAVGNPLLQTYNPNRWRVTQLGYMSFHLLAMYPRNNRLGQNVSVHASGNEDISQDQGKVFIERDSIPVKYEFWSKSMSSFTSFESTARLHMERQIPARITRLDSFDCYPSTDQDLYFVRMITLFSPDVTGTHSFWLRGDDWAMLFIGDDETMESKKLVAQFQASDGTFSGAHSGSKYLEADKMYYMEVLHYEGVGSDWLVVEMIRPGDQDRVQVSLNFLYPVKDEPITPGNIIREFTTYYPLYEVSFDIKPFGITSPAQYTSVLHATIGNNHVNLGDRIPALWFNPGTLKLAIFTAIGNNLNYRTGEMELPTTGYTNIHIKQTSIEGIYYVITTINGTEISRIRNNNPQTFQNVKVYQGDPWHYAAKAYIKNLNFTTTP
ncbi:uncharacterized protein [Clytia hemisphaerica]|uniref:PA14 domain-containing protein n=1 Tax=Clytia hemisphaerica TaxID=252671 RepID=A0A7M6DL78_9CNID